MKWKTFFRPHILERGYGYYLEDKVDIIVESDTEIVAEVEGSETYLVNIGFQNGAIDYMQWKAIIASIWRQPCIRLLMTMS